MLRPAAASTSGQPHCGGREGGKERRRLPHREVWRAAQGDPDMEAAAGIQPPWPRPPDAHTSPDPGLLLQPVPTTLLLAPNPESGILPSPARGTQDSRLSRGAPAPGPARQAEFPLPRMLTPSPPPQPDPRALPRILGPHGPFPAPTPNPGGPGAGEGAQSRARPLPLAPHCSPAAVPGPPGQPPGNPGAPNSRLWGLGKAGRQNPAPGDLTP